MKEVIRRECKQCKKWFHSLEIYLFYCHECWSKRPQEMAKFSTRQHYRECDECGTWVIAGHLAWDCQANAYGLLCVTCYEKKVSMDKLYRGTPFGYEAKAQ